MSSPVSRANAVSPPLAAHNPESGASIDATGSIPLTAATNLTAAPAHTHTASPTTAQFGTDLASPAERQLVNANPPAGTVAFMRRLAASDVGNADVSNGESSSGCQPVTIGHPAPPSVTERSFQTVAKVAREVGLPTQMIHAALTLDRFTDDTEDNYVAPITQTLHLSSATAARAEQWRVDNQGGMGSTVGTVFHEAAHQFLNTSADPRVQQFVQDGTRAYRLADVETRYRGIYETTDDPKTVFHEAVGEYIDEKIGNWETARAALLQAHTDGRLTPEKLELIATQYDTSIDKRTFGYQDSSPLEVVLGEPAHKDTRMPLPDFVKAFIDTELLKDEIPDRFHEVPAFQPNIGAVNGNVCE